MAIALGVDFSSGRPTAAQVRAAGYRFVVRYISHSSWKNITKAEATGMTAGGVAVVLNWETTADRALSGRPGGVTDAKDAAAQAKAVGQPDRRPIYFSVDFDAQPHQLGAIDEYLRGAAEVLGPARVGVYGGYRTVSHCLDAGTARWAWQTGAWSAGRRDRRAVLYQRIGTVHVGGVPCDVNEATADDYGQWPVEDEMPSIEEIRQVIREESGRAVWAFPLENDPTGVVMSAKGRLLDIERKLNTQNLTSLIRAAGVDVDRLVSALVPAIIAGLPIGVPTGVTAEDVENAVRAVLREGVDG